jgi:tRNA(Ile)-lysidine synthase
MNLNNQFINHLTHTIGASTNAKYLLAVSGGVDSMVMLHLFHNAQLDFGVAHCNYSLRGEESNLDHLLVANTCKQLDIPFNYISFETQKISKEQSLGIQETARNLRYQWFQELALLHKFDFIVTAHHLDDSVETILFNLLRGTGLKGLEGIPLKNKNVIRPLLFTTKQSIVKYADNNEIRFRTDASNLKNTYARNKIRNVIIPSLTEINPLAVKHIYNTSNYISPVLDIVNEYIIQLSASLIVKNNNLTTINCGPLLDKSYLSFYLFETLHPYGYNSHQIETIKQLLIQQKSGAQFLSTNYTATVNRTEIIIKKNTQPHSNSIVIESTETIDFSVQDKDYSIIKSKAKTTYDFKEGTIYLDADRIVFPITVRRWQAGDSFSPLGMNGRKKISDYLVNNKISLPEKENVHVIVSNNNIIAVLDYQIDNAYRITPSTQNILQFVPKQKKEKS